MSPVETTPGARRRGVGVCAAAAEASIDAARPSAAERLVMSGDYRRERGESAAGSDAVHRRLALGDGPEAEVASPGAGRGAGAEDELQLFVSGDA